jgi:hypothetical protein
VDERGNPGECKTDGIVQFLDQAGQLWLLLADEDAVPLPLTASRA